MEMRIVHLEIVTTKDGERCHGDCDHLIGIDGCDLFGPLAFSSASAKRPNRHQSCLAAETEPNQPARGGS